MRKLGKILKVVSIFVISLLGISLIWYGHDMSQCIDNTDIHYTDYILYLLGYSDIDMADYYSKTIFSFIGILALTLLSSMFTVNLFEWRRKMTLSSKMIVWDKEVNVYLASVLLKSNQKDIYNLKATLIMSCGNEVVSEECYIPFIPRKSTKTLSFRISPGTVCYSYLRSIIKVGTALPILVLTVVYTDIDNGQEYTICRKYQYLSNNKSDFVFSSNSVLNSNYELISYKLFNYLTKISDVNFEKATKNYIQNNSFYLNMMTATPINAEDIDIIYGYLRESEYEIDLPKDKAFTAKVHMNSKKEYEPKDFCMICISNPWGGNLTKHYDLGCSLNFEYAVKGNISVTWELKYKKIWKECKTNILVYSMEKGNLKSFHLTSVIMIEKHLAMLLKCALLCFMKM